MISLFRKSIIPILFAFTVNHGFSQVKCGFDSHLEEYIQENPEMYQRIAEEQSSWNDNINYESLKLSRRSNYVIPVVVHVIHDNGIGNISQEQIEDALEILNEDMNFQNSDLSKLRAPFADQAANMEMEFKLAKIDPNGNCTNGIVRLNDPNNTYDIEDGGSADAKEASPAWDPSSYFNIWVINSIASNGGNGTILGYARFPSWGINNRYGIVMRHDQFGSIGTSNSDGRTLTHEVGHCLELYHTFQGGCGSSNNCNSGDRVCDTPPANSDFYNCDLSTNSCTNDPTSSVYGGDVVDMIENYMSYHSCQWMFSLGQKSRATNAVTTYLTNLVSSNNLTKTGVNNPETLCKAQFTSNKTVTCVGSSVDFEDLSFFGVTSWSWDFGAYATPQTSSSQNPTVVYNQAGTYDVKLTVSDGTNSQTVTLNNYIIVNSFKSMDYSESFETIDLVSDGWDYNEVDNYNFEITNKAAATGTNSVYIQNRNLSDGDVAYLTTPPLDLTNVSSDAFLKFKYAFAVKDGTNRDQLKIQLSRNCGDTWSSRKTISGNELKTKAASTFSDFVPDGSEWAEYTYEIPRSYLEDQLLIRFQLVNGGGNNLYLDDINIETPLSVGDNGLLNQRISIYPNPSSNFVTIDIDTKINSEANIFVSDITGRNVFEINSLRINQGENRITLSKDQLGSGVYFINFLLDGELFVEKIIFK